jgi:hypothetical protein
MRERIWQDGDVCKLRGTSAVIASVRGDKVLAFDATWTSPVPIAGHVDELQDADLLHSAVDDGELVNLATATLQGDARYAFVVAKLALLQRALYMRERARADGTEDALTGEGELYDKVASERDDALRESEEARALAHDIGKECRDAANMIEVAFLCAAIPGFAVPREPQCHVTIGDAAKVAVDAIAEFGILNRELLAVNAALRPVANGKSETLAACVTRLVKRLAEQDAELVRLRGDAKAPSAHDIERSQPTDPAASPLTCADDCVLLFGHDGLCVDVHGKGFDGGTMATGLAEMAVTAGDELADTEPAPDSGAIAAAAIATWTPDRFRASAHTQLAIGDADEPRSPVGLSAQAKRVYDYLAAEQGPRNADTIKKVVGLGKSDWEKAKDELLEGNWITTEGVRRGMTYRVTR